MNLSERLQNLVANAPAIKAMQAMTKKQIAQKMDDQVPTFNYSVETGPTSYNNYTRDELLTTCVEFKINLLK